MSAVPTASRPETVDVQYNGTTVTLPLVAGSEGEIGIDIRQLRGTSGLITLDPGFGNTGACESAITFIDGERGVLRYRGYRAEQAVGFHPVAFACRL